MREDGRVELAGFSADSPATTIDWSASSQQEGQDDNRRLARWYSRRRDPVASVRGPLVAGSDVLATKHQESRHRDPEDREAA